VKRRRNRLPCTRNNRWFERYGSDGYFCLPRALLFNVVDCIDNATFYAYVALASCHFEGNSTYAGPHVAKLTGKDASAVRGHLADLETLGLITREPLRQGYKILFDCPTRARVKEGAAIIAKGKAERLERRRAAKAPKTPASASELDPFGCDGTDDE
jgi:DNA-binding transcriptional ArsR family regulator